MSVKIIQNVNKFNPLIDYLKDYLKTEGEFKVFMD